MDSVLLEFSMFPTDVGESKSAYVSKVIDYIDSTGLPYKLTPMSTIVETESMEDALYIVGQCAKILELESSRIYSCIKIDYRKNSNNRMEGKIKSVEKRLGKEVQK
ncbi:MAG: MTH1187 family thiamine-binding protein [Campylobacterota bacterium]